MSDELSAVSARLREASTPCGPNVALPTPLCVRQDILRLLDAIERLAAIEAEREKWREDAQRYAQNADHHREAHERTTAVLTIVTAERDGLRQENVALTEAAKTLGVENATLQAEVEKLRIPVRFSREQMMEQLLKTQAAESALARAQGALDHIIEQGGYTPDDCFVCRDIHQAALPPTEAPKETT